MWLHLNDCFLGAVTSLYLEGGMTGTEADPGIFYRGVQTLLRMLKELITSTPRQFSVIAHHIQ